MFAWICSLPLRHTHAQVAAAATSGPTVDDAPPAGPTQPTPPTQAALPPLPALPAPAGTPAPSPAEKSVPAAERPSSPAPEAPIAAGAVTGVPFRNATAVRALDGKWRDVAKCRRGKAWGKASTTVTFSNDGSVSHVEVGEPFGGTPTGDCIVDALTAAHVDPFGDKPGVLVYKVYVAPK